MSPDDYARAGVRGQGEALSALERHLGPTFELAHGARVLTGFGHYASVIQIRDDLALAICTDGVGSKTLVASALGRYDTIGYDCVAMNVNDLICVGARPLALVDYLGVHTLDARRASEIIEGLAGAAKEAGISIPGGETAQLPEIIGSDGRSPGDESAFDLVGTCVGTLHPDELILGRAVVPGDALVGVASSGIHSNGLTLARRVLLGSGRYALDEEVPALGRRLGEELLHPTEIYVRGVAALWDEGIETRGLAHITGDGLANLCRLEAEVSYRIEELPDPPAIFSLIQEAGSVPDGEMFRVFNMGVGLVVVVPVAAAQATVRVLEDGGYRARPIGTVVEGPRRVEIVPRGLVGSLEGGESRFETV